MANIIVVRKVKKGAKKGAEQQEHQFEKLGRFLGQQIWQNRIIRNSKTVYHCFSKIPIVFLPKRICIPKVLGGKLITG